MINGALLIPLLTVIVSFAELLIFPAVSLHHAYNVCSPVPEAVYEDGAEATHPASLTDGVSETSFIR